MHTAVENCILIDTSLGLAYLLAALFISATFLLRPPSLSENEHSIKLGHGMPPALKSQVKETESERSPVIHMTTLGVILPGTLCTVEQ